MKVELQCGDKIAIPAGCKATVADGYVLVEADEWRPKIGDNYFIIDPEDGSGVMVLSYDNDSIDNINLKIGIAFRTRELAEAALETLKQCKHY